MPSREFHTPITGTPVIRTAMNTALGELDEAVGNLSVNRAVITDQRPLGSGTLTGSMWNVRTVSSMVNPNSIVTTLDTFDHEFRMAAGTYLMRVRASVYNVGLNRLRLYNVTGASVVAVGLCHNVGSAMDVVRMACIFTATGSQDYRIEHYAGSTVSGGQGQSLSGLGLSNEYMQVMLMRIGT